MCISPQRHAIFRHLHRQKWSKHAVFCTFWLSNVLFATAACNFSTSEQTKVVQTCGVLYILTFKCAFRHSGVQFFDIWTDKSGPNMRCFVHFDFQMCISPQRRAIFRHLNRQKCSEPVMFCTFWLSNVLFATAACNFWFLLKAPTSAPAALTGLLFDWPDTRIIEKTQHFATSLTFGADVSSFFWPSRYCIFCRLTWLLYYCFSTLDIVGSFYLNFLRQKLTTCCFRSLVWHDSSRSFGEIIQFHVPLFLKWVVHATPCGPVLESRRMWPSLKKTTNRQNGASNKMIKNSFAWQPEKVSSSSKMGPGKWIPFRPGKTQELCEFTECTVSCQLGPLKNSGMTFSS